MKINWRKFWNAICFQGICVGVAILLISFWLNVPEHVRPFIALGAFVVCFIAAAIFHSREVK